MSPNERVLKVGIIGLGHLHPRSYMALFDAVPATQVVAVAEADAERRQAFCSDFGVTGFAAPEEMLEASQLTSSARTKRSWSHQCQGIANGCRR